MEALVATPRMVKGKTKPKEPSERFVNGVHKIAKEIGVAFTDHAISRLWVRGIAPWRVPSVLHDPDRKDTVTHKGKVYQRYIKRIYGRQVYVTFAEEGKMKVIISVAWRGPNKPIPEDAI